MAKISQALLIYRHCPRHLKVVSSLLNLMRCRYFVFLMDGETGVSHLSVTGIEVRKSESMAYDLISEPLSLPEIKNNYNAGPGVDEQVPDAG